ncbi:hypothetical protein SALBM311S_01608 [Streptomyces alboniger]
MRGLLVGRGTGGVAAAGAWINEGVVTRGPCAWCYTGVTRTSPAARGRCCARCASSPGTRRGRRSEFAPEAGLLEAAPFRLRYVGVVVVDPDRAEPQPPRDPGSLGLVARPDGAGEAVDGVVRDAYHLVLAGEALDREHRPEGLLLDDRHPCGALVQHGRRIVEAVVEARPGRARTTASQDRSLLQALGDIRLDLRAVRRRDGGPVCDCSSNGPPRRMIRARRTTSSTNRSCSESSTSSRAPAEQTCPECRKTAVSAMSTAVSKSASAKTMLGFLPPSSSATFFTVPAAAAIRPRPVWSPPVNETRSTSGWSASGAPA